MISWLAPFSMANSLLVWFGNGPSSAAAVIRIRRVTPVPNKFSTAELVRAIREHDPDSDMPLIQIADLGAHRLKLSREIAHFGQCGRACDFGSLLNFAVWMLYFVDYEHDGSIIDRVVENACCQNIGIDEFQALLGGLAGNLKTTPPDFLSLPQTYTTAIKIYDGWIDSPKTRYNLRSTFVWESGDRLIAFHTRFDV
ncbi:MAG: hypothetical protein ACO1RT_01760 [Planctomycetaceae bacterium]